MRVTHISENDLKEALRQHGHHDLENIDAAYLERNGSISIIPVDSSMKERAASNRPPQID